MKTSALSLVLLMSAIASGSNLPFITDDYPKALDTAKQRNLPMFVEVWAPW